MKQFLLTICFSVVLLSVNAQWTTDTLMNTIIRDTTGAATPLISSALNGSTYFSWFETGANGYELRMQLLDSSGNKMWAPEGIVVSSEPQSSAIFRYDLKTDNDGNAIVAFQDIRNTDLHVVAYKIDTLGNSLWGPTGVSLTDPSEQQGLGPVIGITSLNDVYVAWNADSAGTKWIACQQMKPSGNISWSDPIRIRDTLTSMNYSRPKLLPIGIDSMQILYVEEQGSFPGVTSVLFYNIIEPSGQFIYPFAIQFSTNTIPYFFFPEPVNDINGGMYLSFTTSNPNNTSLNDVFVQHIDSTGVLWSAGGTEAATSISNHKLAASSCIDPINGNFWVLLQVLDGGQGSSGVSVQKFDSAGNGLLGPDGLELITMDPIYYNPHTINDAGDGIILSYSYGPFGNQHIDALKIDYSGNTAWSGVVSLCAVNSNKDDVQSGKMFNNNLVLGWQDDRNGAGVFAQNIFGDGTTGVGTGISSVKNEFEFVMYPNPSSSPDIIFSSSDQFEKTIAVRNVQGKKLFSNTISGDVKRYSLNIPEISSGVYFISVSDQNKNQTLKWIKQ